jgi:hypothetical protein
MSHKFNCDVCHKIFVNIEKFRQHKLKHDNEPDLRNLHCSEPGCTAKFSKPYCLQMHKMKHSNEFPYPCTECTMVFRCSSGMNKHLVRKHNHPDCSVRRKKKDSEASSTVFAPQADEKLVTHFNAEKDNKTKVNS